jgi:hypothetical protein
VWSLKVHLLPIDVKNPAIFGRAGESAGMGLVERDDGCRIPDVLWA